MTPFEKSERSSSGNEQEVDPPFRIEFTIEFGIERREVLLTVKKISLLDVV